MIHYTCDMCGKSLSSQTQERYRVLIDIERRPPGADDSDLEGFFDDHYGDFECELGKEGDGLFQTFRFDLCPECAQTYVRDPLARSGERLPRRPRFLDN